MLATLAGCGAASPQAQSPAEVAVVHLDASAKPKEETKAPVKPVEQSDVQKVLQELADHGMVGLLNSGDTPASATGVLQGASAGGIGGLIGGSSSSLGAGGLGLSGVGVGGGGVGTGIGLGSLGTGRVYGVVGGSYGNPISGQSIHMSGNDVVEVGDVVTLGVPIEAGVRVLRDRMFRMRECYEKGLSRDKKLTGGVSIRLLVGRSGKVDFVREVASDIADKEVVSCVLRELKDVSATTPSGSLFGVIEASVRFWSKKP